MDSNTLIRTLSSNGSIDVQGNIAVTGDINVSGDNSGSCECDPNKIFDELKTTEKTIVGAINELYDLITNQEEEEVDPDQPMMMYGFIPASVHQGLGFDDVTWYMLTRQATQKTVCEPKPLEKTLINVPEGGMAFVIIPNENYVVTKDDGVGGKVLFSGDIDMAANGYRLELNGVKYVIYGELMLVDAPLFIYVDEK